MKRDVRRSRAGRRVGRRDQQRLRGRGADASTTKTSQSCRAMGAHGAELVPDVSAHPDALQRRRPGDRRVRHGARRDPRGRRSGKENAVLADETRPFLQGARLTAWELVQGRHRTTVITDNMAGAMMRLGQIVWSSSAPTASPPTATSPTRSAPTGSRCSPSEHGIPFYVAAPMSTIDLRHAGRRRTSRSRSATRREVTHVGAAPMRPKACASAIPPST